MLLTVSVASFSTGLAFVVGLAVGLSLAPDRRRRLWVVAVRLALYIVWWLWARENAPTVGGPELSNILLFPSYSYVSLAAVFASLSGLNFDFSVDAVRLVSLGPGPLLALLALAGLVLRVSKGSLPRFFWIGAAMLSAYWILGTLVVDPASGIRVPTKTRYMFPGTVLVILVGAALLTQWKPARQSIVALVAVAACAFATNLALLLDGTAYFRNDFSASAKAQFAMLDLAAERTAPDFDPRYQSPDFSVISTPAGPTCVPRPCTGLRASRSRSYMSSRVPSGSVPTTSSPQPSGWPSSRPISRRRASARSPRRIRKPHPR